MKTSKAALVLVLVGALVGCGDDKKAATATAEPAKSGAPAAKSGAPAASGSAGAGAAATSKPAQPTESAAAAGSSDLLKHMPKDCDEGRVYVNMGKSVTGDAGTALESLMAQGMAKAKDDKKGEEVVKVLKDGGLDPIKGIKEIAVCASKSDDKTLVAIAADMSKAEKPADVLAKAIETGSGKAPKKEEAGEVTYLMEDGGKDVIAVVGKSKLVVGKDKAAVEAAVKGADGAGEFGDALAHVIWAKMTGNSPTDVAMKEAGDNFDLKVSTKAGPQGAKMKEEFEKTLPQVDEMATKMPFVKPLLPAIKNAKLEVAGEMLNVSTSFPKTTLGEFLNGIKDMKPEQLMGLGAGM